MSDWRTIRTVRALREFLADFQTYTPSQQTKTVTAMLDLISERRSMDIEQGLLNPLADNPRRAVEPHKRQVRSRGRRPRSPR